MPRPIKSPLKPTKFEDLDTRTQKFIKEKELKEKSGGKKPSGNILIKGKSMTRDELKKASEELRKASNRKKFKSPMQRQRKIDKMKDQAAKTGGGFFTMDEMTPLQTLTSKGPGEVENTPTGLKSGGRAGFKSGSKGCKLAKRGRGRAYGKNS